VNIPSIHVCLVSDQPTPNLTPLLDERTRPGQVVLLVSEEKKEQAGHLAAVIGKHGLPVRSVSVRNPWDIEKCRDDVLDLLAGIESSGPALNVTGGTKPMAIAAHEVFRSAGLPIFYVHPLLDRLIWLHPRAPSVDLANRVRIADFLEIHGYRLASRINRTTVPREWSELSKKLVQDVGRYGKPLGVVNTLASSAGKTLVSVPIEPEKLSWPDFMDLVRLFGKSGLLSLRDDRLHFPDEACRAFVNGGWLELHVKACIDRLRSRPEGRAVQDVALGLEVCSARDCSVKNEIDVLFLADNRLHLIECKTRRFDPAESHGAETLYKLDTLKNLGGLRARTMLASFRELPSHDARRAEDLGIRTVVGTRIQGLEGEIERWLKS